MRALLLMALLLVGQAYAETRYISDVIYVPMRAGPGNQYRILHRGLKTGTSMQLLEEDAGNTFSKIRYGDEEGYIRSQYLTSEAPALIKLPEVQAQLAKRASENRELRERLNERDQQIKNLSAELKNSEQQLTHNQEEMLRLQEIAAAPQAIDQRNRQLVAENLQLKDEVQVLQAQYDQLARDNSIRWYLYGGGTILLGILLGFFLPMVRVRKKQSDWV